MTTLKILPTPKKWLAWGGFSNGNLDHWTDAPPGDEFALEMRAVFATRKDARRAFYDVRRIEIREVTT